MSKYGEKAVALHSQGYNCAQAVACAFAEELGLDEPTLFKTMEGFGFGMGNSYDTCGAVSGAVAIAGLAGSDGTVTSKRNTYKVSAAIKEAFKAKNQSTICRELKGLDTGVVMRSCPGCVEDAAEVVAKIVFHQ